MKKILTIFLATIFIASSSLVFAADAPRKEYYENGTLKFEEYYTEDKTSKEIKEYAPDGHLETFKIYKVHPFLQLFDLKQFYAADKLKSESYYGEKGEIGYYKTFYENGQLKSEVPIVERRWHGEEKHYSPTGTLEKVMQYENGYPKGYKTATMTDPGGSDCVLSFCHPKVK